MYEFQLKSHWSLFLGVQLMIFQHWFRWWLGAGQATSHYLNQWWHSLLTQICITLPQWVKIWTSQEPIKWLRDIHRIVKTGRNMRCLTNSDLCETGDMCSRTCVAIFCSLPSLASDAFCAVPGWLPELRTDGHLWGEDDAAVPWAAHWRSCSGGCIRLPWSDPEECAGALWRQGLWELVEMDRTGSAQQTRGTENTPISQILQCTCQISQNAPFCNRNVHMFAHFYFLSQTGSLWDLWFIHEDDIPWQPFHI